MQPAAKRRSLLFPLCLTAAMAVFYGPLRLFDGLEDFWQDKLHTLHEARLPASDPRIIIAAIDDETAESWGWPFTRDVHAELIDALVALGVKTIAFDVIFLNPDKRTPGGDRALIEATRRSGRTVHSAAIRIEGRDVPGERIKVSYRMPLAGLAEASVHLGYPNVNHVIDADGHLRRIELFSAALPYPLDRRVPFPSLAVAAAAAFAGKPIEAFTQAFPSPWRYVLSGRRLSLWPRHPYLLERGGTWEKEWTKSMYQYVSVADILGGRLTLRQKGSLKGSLVLVGTTISGLFDHYPSPFSQHQPAVEFHANAVDDILHGDFTRPVPRARTMLILACGIWLPVLLADLEPLVAADIALAALIGWIGFTQWQFLRQVRYEFVAPALGLAVSFASLTARRVLEERAGRRRIQQTFGQFVAPEVVDQLVRDPSQARLGGQKREMTMFFLDIAHFTSISETMDPDDIMRFLNRYLSEFIRVIHRHQGVVDKYIGDCIMAFWNAPLEQPRHRASACLAAVECQQALELLNAELGTALKEPLAIRIGINSGPVNVGFTGAQQRLQYTVIGDNVNLASRLEGANKFFGTRIAVSGACFDGAKDDVEARLLGKVRVLGKAVPIEVYEILGKKGHGPEIWKRAMPAYARAMASFLRGDFKEAESGFEQTLDLIPGDQPSRLYAKLAKDYLATAAPADWDVLNLATK